MARKTTALARASHRRSAVGRSTPASHKAKSQPACRTTPAAKTRLTSRRRSGRRRGIIGAPPNLQLELVHAGAVERLAQQGQESPPARAAVGACFAGAREGSVEQPFVGLDEPAVAQ